MLQGQAHGTVRSLTVLPVRYDLTRRSTVRICIGAGKEGGERREEEGREEGGRREGGGREEGGRREGGGREEGGRREGGGREEGGRGKKGERKKGGRREGGGREVRKKNIFVHVHVHRSQSYLWLRQSLLLTKHTMIVTPIHSPCTHMCMISQPDTLSCGSGHPS